jgi:hypothetical protein
MNLKRYGSVAKDSFKVRRFRGRARPKGFTATQLGLQPLQSCLHYCSLHSLSDISSSLHTTCGMMKPYWFHIELLTNCTNHGPSWETGSHSPAQEIRRLLWNHTVIYT